MTRDEAKQQLAKLSAAYPSAPFEEKTYQLYIDLLLPVDYWIAKRAVDLAIRQSDFFPTVATLFTFVDLARVEKRREEEERLKRERQAEGEEIERPPLESIDAAMEMLRRFQIGKAEPPPPLPRAEDGLCDDCLADTRGARAPEKVLDQPDGEPEPPTVRSGPRFEVGSFRLCARHAIARQRVRAKLTS